MDIDPRIKKLRELLECQIEWYQKNKDDPDTIYDEMFAQFNDMSRGGYVALIEIVLADEDFVYPD